MSTATATPVKAKGYSDPIMYDVEDIDPRPACEVRVSLDEEAIADYAAIVDELDPIRVVIDESGKHWTEDGAHRLQAHVRLGRKKIKIQYRTDSYLGAFRGACRANEKHGVKPSGEDKKHRVKLAFSHPVMKEWNQKEIAEACGVDRSYVSKLDDRPVSDSHKPSPKGGRPRGSKSNGKPKPPSDTESKEQPSQTVAPESETSADQVAVPSPDNHAPLPGQTDVLAGPEGDEQEQAATGTPDESSLEPEPPQVAAGVSPEDDEPAPVDYVAVFNGRAAPWIKADFATYPEVAQRVYLMLLDGLLRELAKSSKSPAVASMFDPQS